MTKGFSKDAVLKLVTQKSCGQDQENTQSHTAYQPMALREIDSHMTPKNNLGKGISSLLGNIRTTTTAQGPKST